MKQSISVHDKSTPMKIKTGLESEEGAAKSGTRRRYSQNVITQKDDPIIIDQSLKTLISTTGLGTLFGGTSYGVPTSSEASLDKIISSFVSKQVRRICYEKCSNVEIPAEGSPANLPAMERQLTEAFAAVVMVDVSGYSKLTAVLAERGPQGAELLTKTMKAYLDKIIKTIVAHGGDIVKFAGDAVIFCWKSEKAADLTDPSLDILRGELVYTASKCCLELLTNYGTYSIDIEDCPTRELRIHLGIGAGKIFDVVVGGAPGRWEHFIAGEGVNQLSVVLDLAKAGELALSHFAIRYLRLVIDFNSVDLGGYDKRCIILKGLEKAKRIADAPEEAHDQYELVSDMLQLQASVDLYKYFIDRTAVFKLQADINQSKLFQMPSGLLDLLNLTELRQVTTVFIKIGSLRAVKGEDLLEASQEAITIVQNALYRCEGSLRQFHVDDKGAVILCFFGLPPLAHENDASLGISAGIEIRDKFADTFEEFSIGITTGVVSYGGVGTEGRAEYAVMGDAINMAARLMCLPSAKSAVLCDEKTHNLCEGQYTFDSLGETHVKGKTAAISVFRPLTPVPESNKKLIQKNQARVEIIGREKEKKAIQAALEKVSTANSADNIVIQGEGGQGLTTLVNFTKSQANIRDCHVCTGAGMEMEKNTPYYAFRGILHDILSLIESSYHDPRTHALRIPSINYTSESNASPTMTAAPSLPTATVSVTPIDSLGRKKSTIKHGMDGVNAASLGTPVNPIPVASSAPIPSRMRRMSVKPMSDLDEDDFDTTLDESTSRTRYAGGNMNMIEEIGGKETKSDSVMSFNERARRALAKVEEEPDDADLLDLIMPEDAKEVSVDTRNNVRNKSKDLVALLLRLLNLLTFENKIVIVVSETQWIDSISWELLLELVNGNQKLGCFVFTRPESSYESKENRVFLRRILSAPRTSNYVIDGLSMDETRQMIISTWAGFPINAVSTKIVESIYKRTDGNPFFIRSLTFAMRESGQWRVENGILQGRNGEVDFERLVLGYDNQSIILAQFDRLDRNFQLFLKVASVLGQRFLLDDVLYFLTGMTGLFDRIDRKSYGLIVRGIQTSDRYNFLFRETKATDGVYFQFKSAVVRKCIYDNMVKQQRCQLHLNVASYYESRMKESNKIRFLIPIYEHYRETDDSHIKKRIHYLEMVAAYHYEKNAMSEAVRHYKDLIRLVNEYQNDLPEGFLYRESSTIKWHVELGHALLVREELAEAEVHLLKAFELLGYSYPKRGLNLKWILYKESTARRRRDSKFLATLAKLSSERIDYISSYQSPQLPSTNSINAVNAANGSLPMSHSKASAVAGGLNGYLHGSGNFFQDYPSESASQLHRRSIVGGMANSKPSGEAFSSESRGELQMTELQPAEQFKANDMLRLVLINLSELYRRTGEPLRFEYAVTMGLKFSFGNPDLITGRLFAIGAYLSWIKAAKDTMCSKYMEAADGLDDRSEITTSIHIADNYAHITFLQGKWESAMSHSDVLAHLGSVSGNVSVRIRGLHLRSVISMLSQSRTSSILVARECNALSVQKDSWLGQFWSIADLLFASAGSPSKAAEVERLKGEMDTLWLSASPTFKANPVYQIAYQAIVAWIRIHEHEDLEFENLYSDIPLLLAKITPHFWEVYFGLMIIAVGTITAFQKNLVWPRDLLFLKRLALQANTALKKFPALSIASPIRRLFKGMAELTVNNKAKAVAAWRKGLDDQNAAKYIQAMLLVLVGKNGTTEEDQVCASRGADLLTQIGSLEEFEITWGKLK